MGNGQSNKSDKLGFQVTLVSPNSPGAKAGLIEMEDFVMTVNGLPIPVMEVDKVMNMIKSSANRPVILSVFNTKTLTQRDVVLIPSSDWPGEGLLGIKLKLNSHEALPSLPVPVV